MRKPEFLAGILLPFIFGLFVSCQLELEPFDEETLETKRQLWNEQGLQNYSFYLRYIESSDIWDGTVIVKDGGLFGYVTDEFRYYYLFPDPQNKPSVMKWISPIPEIYENIRNEGRSRAVKEIEYNGIYHFPEYVHIDLVECCGLRFTLSITNFTPNPEIDENILTFDRETFDAEQQLWQEQGLRYYTFRLDYRYDNRPVWEGKINVWDGRWYPYTYYYSGENFGAWRWEKSILEIYDRILRDSQMNPGLEWGRRSRSVLEAEYCSEYHYPLRFRYYAEPVEPSGQEGVYRLYEFAISNFTLLDPLE